MRRWTDTGEYPRSKESYYNPNTRNTKMLFSSWAPQYAQMSRWPALHRHMSARTHTHTQQLCTSARQRSHAPSFAKLHHSSRRATTICTQDDGENARWSDENNIVGGIIIKSQVLTQTETVLILGEQTLMRGRECLTERERERERGDTRHDR